MTTYSTCGEPNAGIQVRTKTQDGLPVSASHSHVRPMRREHPLRAAQPDVGATNRPTIRRANIPFLDDTTTGSR